MTRSLDMNSKIQYSQKSPKSYCITRSASTSSCVEVHAGIRRTSYFVYVVFWLFVVCLHLWVLLMNVSNTDIVYSL